MKRKWIVYHIPKTGGTSLSQHLRGEMQDRFLSVSLREQPGSVTPQQVRALPKRVLEEVEVFQGHGVGRYLHDLLPDTQFAELVVLREPAARLVSHFNFRNESPNTPDTNKLSLEGFLLQNQSNFMLKFMAYRLGYPINFRALDRVLHDLIGMYTLTLDEVDTAIVELSRILGVTPYAPRRNVSGVDFPVRLEPQPQLLWELRELNPLDVILFEAARDLAPMSIDRIKNLDSKDT